MTTTISGNSEVNPMVNEADPETGETRLHRACKENNVDAVSDLIRLGANLEAATKGDLLRPLHVAVAAGHGSVVDILIDNGALIEATDKNEWTSLHHACKGGNAGVLRYLISKGVNKEALNNFNQGPVHIAAMYGHTHIVKILVEKFDCTIVAKDKNGWSPLHVACDRGYIDLVAYLISKVVDKEALNNFNQGPVHIAALNGHTNIVKILVEKFGCTIVAKDKNGWSPLHVACNMGYIDLAAYLISKGAKTADKTDIGQTPLDLARMHSHDLVMKLLEGR